MAAQIKDYAYSDNADVLKGKVNTGKPVQKNDGNITAQMKPGTGVTAQMKDLSPPSPLARDTSRATLQAKSQEGYSYSYGEQMSEQHAESESITTEV